MGVGVLRGNKITHRKIGIFGKLKKKKKKKKEERKTRNTSRLELPTFSLGIPCSNNNTILVFFFRVLFCM